MTNEVTMDRLAKVYIKIRERLSEITRAYETEEAALKARQAEIGNAMKDSMRALGVKTAGTAFGTVALKTVTRYHAQDWEAMHRFILDNDAPFLLEKRIAQTNMTEFLEKNPGTVPPGLNTMSEIVVSVTKPRK